MKHLAASTALALLGAAIAAGQTPASGTATIPLCSGLTIVTAVSQPQGDYESIKRIESVTPEGARIRYSSYMPDPIYEYGSTTVPDPPWVPFVVHRTVRAVDLDSSASYMQVFAPKGVPETVRGTTALGISRRSFRELRDKGKTSLSIFQAVHPAFGINEDGRSISSVGEHRLHGELARIDPAPVMVSVMVNDRMTALPALRGRGKFLWDDSEFYFLNDEANPISLKFRIGIAEPPNPETQKLIEQNPDLKWMLNQPGAQELMQKQNRDRDILQVVKISTRCEDPSLKMGAGSQGTNAPAGGGIGGGSPAASGGASGAGGAKSGLGGGSPAGGSGGGRGAGSGTGAGSGSTAIEDSLAKTGRADVYSIYFAFNSDQLRDESEPTLQEIADVMRRHPDWKLAIQGHTDNVATDGFNLDLSRRRAAAVKNALTKQYRIDPNRLATGGHGESRPKDTNDTLEGRARNRRVELVRSGA